MTPKKQQKKGQPSTHGQEETHGQRGRKKRAKNNIVHEEEEEPQYEEQQQEEGEEAENEDVGVVESGGTNARQSMYLDEAEIKQFTGNLLFNYLDEAKLSGFCTFSCEWYPDIIVQFYKSMGMDRRAELDNSDPMIGLKFNVNGVQGMITEEDLRSAFFMTRHENEAEGCIEDYPTRGWCENWPIKQEECAMVLNNNRRALNPKLVYKYNLNGAGKFVSKVVQGILFPTTSQATELSAIQMFATWALLNEIKVNYPHIILEHIFYHKNKAPQYGMILSHLLVNVKNVPVLECRKREVTKGSMVGKASIAKFEVYLWERALRSKWEIYEQFEEVRHEVWKYNGCRAPKAAPIGWVPRTGGAGEEIYPFPQIEASTSQQPRAPDVETTGFLVDTLKKLLEENILLKNEVNGMKTEMVGLRKDVDVMKDKEERMLNEMTSMKIHMGGMSLAIQRIATHFPPAPPQQATPRDDDAPPPPPALLDDAPTLIVEEGREETHE